MKLTKIGIIGQQCAGKTTAANFICEQFDETEVIKFADPIYATLKAHQQEKNRAFMQEFSDVAKKYFGKNIYVECFKENVKEIELILAKKDSILMIDNPRPKIRKNLIICDDIRYASEFAVAKELGFDVISIDASTDIRKKRAEKLGLDFIENHSSETEIFEIIYKADYVIIDQGISKRKLKKYLKKVLKQF